MFASLTWEVCFLCTFWGWKREQEDLGNAGDRSRNKKSVFACYFHWTLETSFRKWSIMMHVIEQVDIKSPGCTELEPLFVACSLFILINHLPTKTCCGPVVFRKTWHKCLLSVAGTGPAGRPVDAGEVWTPFCGRALRAPTLNDPWTCVPCCHWCVLDEDKQRHTERSVILLPGFTSCCVFLSFDSEAVLENFVVAGGQ